MKLNKVILILFFPVVAQLIFSCCCCDDDPVTPITSVGKIKLNLINNIGGYPNVLPENIERIDSIKKDSFGIAVETYSNQFALCTPNNQFDLFFSSAMACSCPEAYINYDKVKNFKITTLTDFDSSVFAGDDITTYFKLANGTDIQDLITINQDSIDVNRRLFLLLQQPPVESKVYEFEVSFDVNDSLTLRDTTTQVFLM